MLPHIDKKAEVQMADPHRSTGDKAGMQAACWRAWLLTSPLLAAGSSPARTFHDQLNCCDPYNSFQKSF